MALKTKDLEVALTVELFNRSGMSAAVGIIGVAIMVYPHAAIYSWQHYAPWVAIMVSTFVARILFARRALRAIESGSTGRRSVSIEAVLCSITGFGWGSTVFLFDSPAMDQLFYLRLMILAAAMSFVVSSMTAFVRIFLSYVLPIFFTVMAYLLSNRFVEPQHYLMICAMLYVSVIVGVAVINNRRIRAGVASRLEVQLLTEELSGALETERSLREVMAKTAMTDVLTGILNRRGILDNFEKEIAKCQRFARPLAVLMIDIDLFKAINDTYGHASGDLAIQTVALTLQTTLRNTDELGRFGGEEFLVVLSDLQRDGAISAAERFREHVNNIELMLADRRVRITVSVGISFYRDADDSNTLLERADKALYIAKANGRNRVEIEAAGQSCE